jgi:hypothetical protein
VYLSLDDDAPAELASDRFRFVGGGGHDSGRDREAALLEQFPRLIFVDVHI